MACHRRLRNHRYMTRKTDHSKVRHFLRLPMLHLLILNFSVIEITTSGLTIPSLWHAYQPIVRLLFHDQNLYPNQCIVMNIEVDRVCARHKFDIHFFPYLCSFILVTTIRELLLTGMFISRWYVRITRCSVSKFPGSYSPRLLRTPSGRLGG